MLDYINKIYIIVILTLYMLLASHVNGYVSLLYFYAIALALSYFTVLYVNSVASYTSYNYKNLFLNVFIYSAIAVSIQNFISYYYNKNFFIFSTSDAVFYHNQAIRLMNLPITEAIHKYLTYMSFDDLGMILILYPLYHIYPSNLTLNVLYVIVGTISALSLFRLSQNFMDKKYAYFAALTYAISSYVLFFETTGLKEVFMDMVVILSFDYYYRFMNNKNGINLLKAAAFMAMLFLFRPAITIMILGGIGITMQFSKEGGVITRIISVIVIIGFVAMSNLIIEVIQTYTTGGVDTLLEARQTQGGIIGSVPFTYAVNIISQTLGPLPTLTAIIKAKLLIMFYAPGLVYRVFLAFPFWIGAFYMFKIRYYKLYPILIFAVLEMSSLAFLLDGLELRKAMPQMAFIYVIAFWFIYIYDNKKIFIANAEIFKGFFKVSMLILVGLMFYWNFR